MPRISHGERSRAICPAQGNRDGQNVAPSSEGEHEPGHAEATRREIRPVDNHAHNHAYFLALSRPDAHVRPHDNTQLLHQRSYGSNVAHTQKQTQRRKPLAPLLKPYDRVSNLPHYGIYRGMLRYRAAALWSKISIGRVRAFRRLKKPKPMKVTCVACRRLVRMAESHLKRHHYAHLPQHLRPFPCPFPDCSRRFAQKGERETHFLIHLDEVPEEDRTYCGIIDEDTGEVCTWRNIDPGSVSTHRLEGHPSRQRPTREEIKALQKSRMSSKKLRPKKTLACLEDGEIWIEPWDGSMDDGWGLSGRGDGNIAVFGRAEDVDDLLASEAQMIEDPVLPLVAQQLTVAMPRHEEEYEDDEEVDKLANDSELYFTDLTNVKTNHCVPTPLVGPSRAGPYHPAEPSMSFSSSSDRMQSSLPTAVKLCKLPIPILQSPEEMQRLGRFKSVPSRLMPPPPLPIDPPHAAATTPLGWRRLDTDQPSSNRIAAAHTAPPPVTSPYSLRSPADWDHHSPWDSSPREYYTGKHWRSNSSTSMTSPPQSRLGSSYEVPPTGEQHMRRYDQDVNSSMLSPFAGRYSNFCHADAATYRPWTRQDYVSPSPPPPPVKMPFEASSYPDIPHHVDPAHKNISQSPPSQRPPYDYTCYPSSTGNIIPLYMYPSPSAKAPLPARLHRTAPIGPLCEPREPANEGHDRTRESLVLPSSSRQPYHSHPPASSVSTPVHLHVQTAPWGDRILEGSAERASPMCTRTERRLSSDEVIGLDSLLSIGNSRVHTSSQTISALGRSGQAATERSTQSGKWPGNSRFDSDRMSKHRR